MNPHLYPNTEEVKNDDTTRDRQKLAALLDQKVNALSANTAPGIRADVAGVRVGETLAAAVHQGILPVRRHAATLIACRGALSQLPNCPTLAACQTAAEAALRDIVTAEG